VTPVRRQRHTATALAFALTIASLAIALLSSTYGIALLGSAQPAAAQAAKGGKPVVTLTTSLGVIELELDSDKAPITVKNFLDYVDAGFYDGTIFHRVIPGFMIQGGGFDTKFSQKPTRAQIKNEATNGLVNKRGTVAMARTNVVDSATAQFFINLKDNDFLNHSSPDPRGYGYAVFGHVTKGMDVVDKIAAVETGSRGPHGDVPKQDVLIESAKRKK
jgi:cyclophilin family peptidyl-prolyl cis-trans isomerase